MSNPQNHSLSGSHKNVFQKYKLLLIIILGASGLVVFATIILFSKSAESMGGGLGSTPTLASPTAIGLNTASQNQSEGGLIITPTSTIAPTETPLPTVTPTELPVLTDSQLATFGVDLKGVMDRSAEIIDGSQIYLFDQGDTFNRELMNTVKNFFLSLNQGKVPNLRGLDRPLYLHMTGEKGLDVPNTTISRASLEELKAQGASVIYMMPAVDTARREISFLSPTAHFLDSKDRYDKWGVPDKFATLVLGADVSAEISDATGAVFGGIREVGISDGSINLWANPQVVIIVPPGVDLSKFLGNFVFGSNSMMKDFMVEDGIVVVEFEN